MDKQLKEMENYIKARKRIDRIKDYYAHLILFVLGSALLLLLKGNLLRWVESEGIKDPDVLNWVEWNIIFVPILWGLVLLVAAFFVFRGKSNFLKRWEERQMRKFMEKDQ
jgi:putative copper export protein